MESAYRHLDVEHLGDIYCIRLRRYRLDEPALHELGEEFKALVERDGCRKLILSLGPEHPECLFSLFLAKLVSLQRRMRERGGTLLIADAKPFTMGIFDACRLTSLFDFAPDRARAIEMLSQ